LDIKKKISLLNEFVAKSEVVSHTIDDVDVFTIVDDETGSAVNFYDLPQDQREIFVDELLQEDARNISSKLDLVPEASQMLEIENRATTKLITENEIPIMHVGDISNVRLKNVDRLSTQPASQSTKKNQTRTKTIDHKAFFSDLREEIESEMNNQDSRNSNLFTRNISPNSELYKDYVKTIKDNAVNSALTSTLNTRRSTSYGLASTRDTQEPVVTVEINARIKPKRIQKNNR